MKRALRLLCLFAALLLLAACGGAPVSAPASPGQSLPASSAPPPPPPRQDVNIGLLGPVASLAPMFAWHPAEKSIIAQLYEPLLAIAGNTLTPKLAESFELDADLGGITLHLRQGVSFHNGQPFTANDVCYTLDSLKNYPAWAAGAAVVNTVEALGDFTVRITATTPGVQLLTLLCETMIVPRPAQGEGYDDTSPPPGTGPYALQSFDGTTALLTLNTGYYGWADDAPPAITEARYVVYGDGETLAAALQGQTVDYAAGLPKGFAPAEDFETALLPGNALYLLAVNCGLPPFDDALVRQAIGLAADRVALGDAVDTTATPWQHYFLPRQAAAPAAESLPAARHDPDTAKALLAQAGYPDGLVLEQPVAVLPQDAAWATVLQQQLLTIGVEFGLEIVDTAVFSERLFAGNYQLAPLRLPVHESDMAAMAEAFYSLPKRSFLFPCGAFGSVNTDALIAEAAQLAAPAERQALYTQLYALLEPQQPLCVLLLEQQQHAWAGGLQFASTAGLPPLDSLYWTA